MAGPPTRESYRIRRGRMCAVASALLVTLVTMLGAVGVLPTDTPAAAAATKTGASQQARLSTMTIPDVTGSPPPRPARPVGPTHDPTAIPAETGEGKRVVFDISDQRVWLVGNGEKLRRTYLVSGSLYDNLGPGTYDVYSRSRWAVGIDNSGTMEWFVRFTRGDNAPIGFHSIPTKDGRPLQSRAQLGTPQSHGCIRQAEPDARRLWNFAPIGTKVVVTA